MALERDNDREKIVYSDSVYGDSAIPLRPGARREEAEVPEKIHAMRRLYEYGDPSFERRCQNFYRQGKFMEDYEDDYPWNGEYHSFFPTYQDLNNRQLRGYFSWRTKVRKGEFHPITASLAYLYLYELINGIGVSSPEDSLEKMKAFETGYVDKGFGDGTMRLNIHHWMFETAVVRGVSPDIARQYAKPLMVQKDETMLVLQKPEEHTGEEIFAALCVFAGKRTASSPVFSGTDAMRERGIRLFAESWRQASENFERNGKDLFTLCFGTKTRVGWNPLANALYVEQAPDIDREYELDASRRYLFHKGLWQVERYDGTALDSGRIRSFAREADRKLRIFLHAGHPLKEQSQDKWADPYIDAAIAAVQKAEREEKRNSIHIDLSGLGKIRDDAQFTEESLLTEEEKQESLQAERQLNWEAQKESLQAERKLNREEKQESLQSESQLNREDKQGNPQGETLQSVEEKEESLQAENQLNRTEKQGNMQAELPPGREEKPEGKSTEEETSEVLPAAGAEEVDNSSDVPDSLAERFSLKTPTAKVLAALLRHEPVSDFIRKNHLMPSILADEINEAFFDDIGDTVVSCDDDVLSLVEDYEEDLRELLENQV